MQNIFKFSIGIILCCFLILATAKTTQENNFISIGAIFNLTGNLSSIDLASKQGAELAIKEINDEGGVLGKKLELKIFDGQSNQKNIAKYAKELASSKAIANIIIGINDTDMAIAAIPEIAAKQKLFITTGATSPKLSALAPESVLFACFVDSDQAAAGAEFVFEKLNLKNVIIISQKNMEYAQLLSSYFQESYAHLGGKVLAIIPFDSEKINLDSLKNLQTQPDLFFVACDPISAPLVINKIRDLGFKQPILGGDSFDSNRLITKGAILNDIYFTAHAFIAENNPDAKVAQFIKKFRKAFHKTPDSSFAALGYDTVKLLATAINNAKTIDTDKVRTALLNIKNYDGITGTFTYSDNNPIPLKTVSIIQIQNNKKSLVEERQPQNRIKF